MKIAAALLGAALVAAAIGAFLLVGNRTEKLDHLSAAKMQFAIGTDAAEAPIGSGQGSPTEFDRQDQPDVYYHVLLQDVPLGKALELNCEWIDPNGHATRHNRYHTKFIYKPTWPTHCHQRFSAASAPGPWHVQMQLNGRVLGDSSFLLR